MSQLVIDLIRFIIELIEKACKGDDGALKKLCEIAPENMRTEIVAKVQDERDVQKFGPRSGK